MKRFAESVTKGFIVIAIVMVAYLVGPQDAAAQTLSSISPSLVAAGAGNTTITVRGQDFAPGATVLMNGIAIPTTFVSSTQLSAVAPAALLATSAIVLVSAYNPGSSGGLDFRILTVAALLPPEISSIAPASMKPGQTTAIRIAGSNLLGSTLTFQNSVGTVVSGIQAAVAVDSTPSMLALSLTCPAGFPVGTYYLKVSTPAGVSLQTTIAFTVFTGGAWSVAPPLPSGAGDTGSTGVRLLDGRIFVTGSRPVLFNPTSNAWEELASPAVTQSTYSSVLLADGRVLVAGGGTSAEIYDPATNRWNTAGFLTKSYTNPQLILLSNGKVLIAGASFEILDPQTGTSSALSQIPLPPVPAPPGLAGYEGPNSNYKAVVLSSGEILFASRFDGQIYNPQTGVWTATGSTGAGLPWRPSNDQIVDLNSVVQLLDGRLLATSTKYFSPGGGYSFSSEVYDPNSRRWASTNPGWAGAAILLLDGTVLTAGEKSPVNFGNLTVTTSHTYDASTGLWNLNGPLSSVNVSSSLTLLNDGRVLQIGGSTPQFFTYDFTPPVPAVNSVSTYYSDSNVKTLLINGTGFLPNSTVRLGSSNLVTTFLTSNRLMAFIPSSLFPSADPATVSVLNPAPPVVPNTKPSRSADFDGDGRSDISVYRPSTGTWWIERSSSNFTAYNAIQWGVSGDVSVPGDYDGDGKNDIAVYRPSTGTWWILPSSANYSMSAYLWYPWGVPGDVPVTGDYDGDGKTDIAVYRPSDGSWWILRSSTNYSRLAYLWYPWGMPGDVAAPGDYDGDGRTDIAVYRPSAGTWWILKSSTGYSTSAYVWSQWGLPDDVSVPGDYDGDGKADIAVYRPSTGVWWILGSRTNYDPKNYFWYQWGMPGDVPVAGDFDGDGWSDIAVYRPSTGVWWVLPSNTRFTNYVTYQWGMPGDVPVLQKP